MIHKYKYNDRNIVLDVNSGSIHVVDDVMWEVIDVMERCTGISEREILRRVPCHSKNDILEAFKEANELKTKNRLFSKAPYIDVGIRKLKKPVVKALCIHVAHDCNLCCRYCFAGEGEYHGKRSMMSAGIGRRALDFLVKNSGVRRNLEVDFFGGEPTINFEVVKQIVEYGRSLEKIHNKKFRFTLTTNAFSISDDIIEYANRNMANLVLSIDGREETNDRMRPDRSGSGSYDKVIKNIGKFVEGREGRNYYLRGTFTRRNIDFAEDVLHLYKLGFKEISLEPVVATGEAEYSLRKEDLPALFAEYEKLTKIIQENNDLSFFHFNIDLTGGACVLKRISGCGAGCEYMAVTPDGSLYPCHQFVGLPDFKIGSVFSGIANKGVVEDFSTLDVHSKEHCRDCWAKYYCSGGCAANSYLSTGSLSAEYELGCSLQKKRIECAIYLKCVQNE